MTDLKTQEENEAFYSLERKLTEKLIKEEMIKSFKEISEYDRIEITNQNHTSIKNTDFKTLNTKWDMYIPFIRNGVMMIFGHSDRVVYNHFMIKSINAASGIIELCMDIYTNTNGYYSKLMDFDCTLTDINDKIKCHYKNIKYSFNYYEELIRDELIELTKDELDLYKDYSHEFFNNIKKEYKTNKNY